MVVSKKVQKVPRTFLYMPNRSTEQILESSGRIEKVVEISRLFYIQHMMSQSFSDCFGIFLKSIYKRKCSLRHL